ncbi:uncharacterized protein LOC111626253 [Centruroides sculpturatus]|uniref:uncharacterized protein LOC111626253 n=1 Tax=Centruroides sculpturatus TaxID=218467 RepID=UPI000C6D7E90|nr:uncharacterized protein LOC111626253 [Centruroides sculpturatus]
MSAYLPVNNFRWLHKDEINALDIRNISDKNSIGYILEVDLKYPENIHDRHDNLPLAAEHINIPYELLSNYQKTVLNKLNLKYTNTNKKLIPTLFDKTNYIIHYRNLKFYLEEGLIVTKIHRVLAFYQSAWLKKYINFNNKKRQESTNDFDKSFFKLMNNSFFGKTCQNVRKRINLKAATTLKQYRRYLSKSSVENFQIINDNLTIFKMKKPNLILDKPIYIGFCVLELSKLHIYETFYKIFKNRYGENVHLLYTDTDSLTLQIYTNDVYEDFKSFPDIFDFSNYPKTHKLYNEANKNKLGYFKDETLSKPIIEFCSLKPKMYSYIFDKQNKKTAKGVKKSVVKTFNHDKYKEVLFNTELLRQQQYGIKSKNPVVTTYLQNKISLSPFYDKKFILDNGIDVLSFSHYNFYF